MSAPVFASLRTFSPSGRDRRPHAPAYSVAECARRLGVDTNRLSAFLTRHADKLEPKFCITSIAAGKRRYYRFAAVKALWESKWPACNGA